MNLEPTSVADTGPSASPKGMRAKQLQAPVGLIANAVVAAFLLAMLGSVAVLVRAASRGLDLTDEGIYLITYRWYKSPELTFSSSSALFGPLFRILSWDVTLLRIAKLIITAATSGFLGLASVRYFAKRIPVMSRLGRAGRAAFVLAVTFGGLSIYSWLPQSPGYNDLAVFLATTALATTLFWVDAEGAKARVLFACLGLEGTLLFFAKWPSAFCVGALLFGFAMLVARQRLIRMIPFALAGVVSGLVLVQLIAGQLGKRFSSLFSSSGAALESLSFKSYYFDPYVNDFRHVATEVAKALLPVLVITAIAVVIARRARVAGLAIMGAALLFGIGTAWRNQWFEGGSSNVGNLENLYPYLVALAATFTLFCRFAFHSSEAGPSGSPQSDDTGTTDTDTYTGKSPKRNAIEIGAGLAAVASLPLAQALGTGNPPLTVAACVGSSWAAAILVIALIGIERAGLIAAWPALVLVAALGFTPLALGVRGVWQHPFRVTGGLSEQTSSVPKLPALKHLRVDAPTAEVLTKLADILSKNDMAGRPAINTFSSVGMSFALGLRHPPAAMYVEEEMPEVLIARIKEACDIDALTETTLPVVFSAGVFPKNTETALKACGIDFPNAYRSEEVVSPVTLATGLIPTNITVWIPNR